MPEIFSWKELEKLALKGDKRAIRKIIRMVKEYNQRVCGFRDITKLAFLLP